jgi:hypothetical protein
MGGLVVVAAEIPWADTIRVQFESHGYASEIRSMSEDCLRGDPAAVLLSLESWDEKAYETAAGLRGAGFRGVLMVLGRIAPDLTVRQRLAAGEAWYLPAFSSPEDIVSRARMLLS